MRAIAVTASLFLISVCLCEDNPASINVRDFRASVGVGSISNFSGEFNYKAGANSKYATQKITTDDAGDDNPVLFSLSYNRASIKNRVAFLWSLGIEASTASEQDDGEYYDTNTFGGRARGGLAVSFSDKLHAEIAAEIGLGYMTVDDADVTTSGATDRATATGDYNYYGISAGLHYHIKRGWTVGAEGRASKFSARTDCQFNTTGGSYTASFDWVMVSGAIVAGYRF